MSTRAFWEIFGGAGGANITTLNASESRVIEGIDVDYNTAITATTRYNYVFTSPSIGTHNINQSGEYKVFRSFIKFDFSAVVGSVTEAKLYMTDNVNAGAIQIQLCGTTSDLTLDDYDSFSTIFGTGANADYILDGMNRRVYFITMNAAAIAEINNKGTLRVVARSNNDVNAITPGSGFASYYLIMPYITLKTI